MGYGPSLAKSADAKDAYIRAEGLACVRGERLLFRGLNFACAAGQALQITGANGIGKSSLLRLLAGLLKPYAGTMEVKGALALSDERLAMDTHWNLQRSLDFWARLDGRGDTDITSALELTGLADLADVPVRYFSTGQRKRAALARVAASGADIWLLDEPANGLDTQSVVLLGTMMQRHLEAGGIVIAASHQPLPLENPRTLSLADYRP